MPRITYRGLTTKKLYVYAALSQVPGTDDALGRRLINGEKCVPTNSDGAPLRGYAGPSPANDPYAPGATYSPWEQS